VSINLFEILSVPPSNTNSYTWANTLYDLLTGINMGNKNLLFLLSLSLAVSSNVLAEELDNIVIEDVLTINPNSADANDINRVSPTSSDGGDFLTQVNGVSMSRFGGRGLEPIVRGQSQTRLNILLDGAYIHGGCPNRMDPPASWAALETYENVTVLKGVQTLAYGSGGSGGTVLFERDTRDLAEDKGVHGRVSATFTDNAISHDLLADVVAAGEKGYLRGIGEIKKAQNYEDGDGVEVRSSYDHKQAGIIAGFTPTEDRLFEFSFERNSFSDALYPGAGMDSPTEDADIIRLRYEDKPATDKIDSIKAEAYLSDVDHLMDNYSLRTPPTYMAWHPKAGQDMLRATPTTSKTTGGRIIFNSTAGASKWEYGVDLQRNTRNASLNNMDSGTAVPITLMWPDITIQQLGLFAESTRSLSKKDTLKYGLRIDQVDVSAGKANDMIGSMPMGGHSANQSYAEYYGSNAEDKDETNIGGLLRYDKDMGNGISLFTGLSRSVRTADSTERGINKWSAVPGTAPVEAQDTILAGRWIGNPDIKPEKHHQFDIGLSKTTDTLDFSAVAFYDKVDDYILRDTARGQDGILKSDGADIYRNVDAELYGLEFESKIKLSNRLDLSGSIAFVRATNTTDDNRPIAQTPPINGKLQLDYTGGKWGAGARVNFASRQDRIDVLSKQEVGETAGYGTLDLYGNYKLNKSVSLRAGIDNVMDKTYAEHASRSNIMDINSIKVNEPGRTAWLKITAEF
jgi:iron complex outermembrane receptor protein